MANVTFIFGASPNTKPEKKKWGGTWHIISPHLKKWWVHFPRVPHQIARMGKANAVLREVYRSLDKKEAFKHRKTVSFTSVFVPILTYSYGNESWFMTERILTQVQAPKMGFLWRVHSVTKGCTGVRLRPGQETNLAPPYLNLRYFGSKCIALKKKLTTLLRLVSTLQWFGARGIETPRYTPGVTLRDKVRSCEIRRALNVETLLLTEKTQLKLVGPCIQNAQRKTGEASPAG